MNTDPLPCIPTEQSSSPSARTLPWNDRTWRELILEHQVEFIWHRLAGLAQARSESESDIGDKTQDLFLRLLNGRRFNAYIDENWSEEDINRELMSLMR